MRTFVAVLLILGLMSMTLSTTSAWAADGDDADVSRPDFSREGGSIIASLIPQGKNTKIDIRFTVSPGTLSSVEGMDVDETASDEIDKKDFRSALFVIEVKGLSPGGEAKISAASNYFTSATEYWVFRSAGSPEWSNSMAENIALPDGANELVVHVTDGGPMDSDGLVNGSIRMVGGPRDSFWGYALGTLFIRFFGIFLMLLILMVGLMLSSRIFSYFEGKKKNKPYLPLTEEPEKNLTEESDETPAPVSPETAAAIGLAWHLHLKGQNRSSSPIMETEASEWIIHGRALSLNSRQGIFDRSHCISKETGEK